MRDSICCGPSTRRVFPGQLHQHKVWLHGLRGLFAAGVGAGLRGHGPFVFAVIENFGLGDVIETVGLGLPLQQNLGVANMLAERGGHQRCVFEERWEDGAPCLEDRVFGVEDVEGDRAMVGIDDGLHAVAHVVVAAVVGRVGIVGRARVAVQNPLHTALAVENQIGIVVEGE